MLRELRENCEWHLTRTDAEKACRRYGRISHFITLPVLRALRENCEFLSVRELAAVLHFSMSWFGAAHHDRNSIRLCIPKTLKYHIGFASGSCEKIASFFGLAKGHCEVRSNLAWLIREGRVTSGVATKLRVFSCFETVLISRGCFVPRSDASWS